MMGQDPPSQASCKGFRGLRFAQNEDMGSARSGSPCLGDFETRSSPKACCQESLSAFSWPQNSLRYGRLLSAAWDQDPVPHTPKPIEHRNHLLLACILDVV